MIQIFGVPYLKEGSGIHIKKKNRGKFTEYCGGEVTDKCIQRAKKSKNPTLRKRATFAQNARKWKHANGGIFKYQDGTPEGGIQRSYIGGSTSEARKKYFNLDKELTQVVTNLATSYGISPALVIDRLAHEGIIDEAINENNWISAGNDPKLSYFSGGSSIVDNNSQAFNLPYGLFGLDCIFDTYTKGIVKTKRPINFQISPQLNESNERVNSGWTNNIYDTLELFVAELASRREQVKKQYPNLTDKELDSATAARYNATNKYFKQLMDSGEYKTKYPINVEGINIPAPTKTDSKYIQSQTKELDLNKTFRNLFYEDYIYDDKCWNPDLFLKDDKVIDPDNKIVKGILERYAKSTFSEPKQVNFVYKEGAKIHKPDGHRAITDNGWIPTKRLKKGTYGLTNKWQRN